MLKKQNLFGLAIAVTLYASSAAAAVSEGEAAQLGRTLTPLGGELAGNAAGTIPAWTGGLTTAPTGYNQASITLILFQMTNHYLQLPKLI